jgi:hypothetical protein
LEGFRVQGEGKWERFRVGGYRQGEGQGRRGAKEGVERYVFERGAR